MNEKDKAFAFRCLTNVFNQVDVVDVCDEQQILLIANLSTQEMSMAKVYFYRLEPLKTLVIDFG